MTSRVIVALLIVAACSPTGEAEEAAAGNIDETAKVAAEEAVAPDVIEQCDAKDYRPLIGTPVATASVPAGEFLRAYGENDIIVQDYRPRRTSIVYDAKGVVRSVYCG